MDTVILRGDSKTSAEMLIFQQNNVEDNNFNWNG